MLTLCTDLLPHTLDTSHYLPWCLSTLLSLLPLCTQEKLELSAFMPHNFVFYSVVTTHDWCHSQLLWSPRTTGDIRSCYCRPPPALLSPSMWPPLTVTNPPHCDQPSLWLPLTVISLCVTTPYIIKCATPRCLRDESRLWFVRSSFSLGNYNPHCWTHAIMSTLTIPPTISTQFNPPS